MALKSNGEDVIRHGEAVGIGMLCEIFYSEGKSKKFFFIKDLLKKYKLPINIKKYLNYKKNDITKHRIYKNIFLDKKRINNRLDNVEELIVNESIRDSIKQNLILRAKISNETRKYLDNQGFCEVETPYLIKSTPESCEASISFLARSKLPLWLTPASAIIKTLFTLTSPFF